MNTNSFFTLVPTFVSGVKTLRNELIGVALVLAFAGLITHVCYALLRRDAGQVFPTLVRLALISILITSLESWGDTLVSAVNGLISDMGASGTGGNIFSDYQAAIARKMGTAAAAVNSAQAPAQAPQTGQAVPSPLPVPGQQSSGLC